MYWVRGGKDDGKAAQDDFALWGLDTDETRAWSGADDAPDHFTVWPENWAAVQLFLGMQTQWRWTGGMEPRRCGFDYAVRDTVCDELRIPRKERPEVFHKLRMMELAALEAMTG